MPKLNYIDEAERASSYRNIFKKADRSTFNNQEALISKDFFERIDAFLIRMGSEFKNARFPKSLEKLEEEHDAKRRSQEEKKLEDKKKG